MKATLPIMFVILSAIGIAQNTPQAYLPGKIPDRKPPASSPAKAVWVVPATDVVKERSYQEGGRTITVRQIKPIPLPPPPEPEVPAPVEISAEFRERMAAYRLKHPKQKMIALGATVYRLQGGTTRTQFHASGEGHKEPVHFWSSGDFSLLAGIGPLRTLMARPVPL